MVLRDKQTRVLIHKGVLSIGGTLIEVRYGSDRIFFDFGSLYKPELEEDDSLQGMIDHDLIRYVDHLYDPRFPVEAAVEPSADYAHEGIFISHVHLDHSRIVNLSNPEIPVYASEQTKNLLEALNADRQFLVVNPYLDQPTRDIIGVAPLETVHVGAIAVTLCPVDHDAYGCTGFLIHTPDDFIAYSADISLHGFHPELTREFCRLAKGCDLLFMEGVSVSFDDRAADGSAAVSEDQWLQRFGQLVADNAERQITFNGYPANVERFIQLIKHTQRSVVLEKNTAEVLKKCADLECLYYREDQSVATDLNPDLEISKDTLLRDDHHYVWQLLHFDARLKQGGLYIHADAMPLGDFDPAYGPFVEQFRNHGVEFVRWSCSGHASAQELDEIIALIQPQLLVPIHTLKPERLQNPYGDQYYPEQQDIL